MPKTLVFCADGTWNGPDEQGLTTDGNMPAGTAHCEPQLTNVCKLVGAADEPVGALSS
jgi:hypothetical protein